MSERMATEVISDQLGWISSGEERKEVVSDILTALEREGFAVVPVEPTEAMLNAWAGLALRRIRIDAIRESWRGMLTASQEAKDNGRG